MSKIKILDNLTIQKIAAGEVIENPSSIVKELVENSIDANSKSIIVDISNGGKTSIRITDDGDGIEEKDLKIAFERHSTSKLSSIDDIYSIMSLGFRGEALASIASVAKVEVLTKTAESSAGSHGIIEEGKIVSMDMVGCPKGTTMIVRDLFYNLPVRKKFLKSDITEGNYISDIVNKLALGNPKVAFKFIRDNKTILQTSNSGELIDTIYTVLGKDFSKNLIPIDYSDDYISIKGFISNNNLYRGNRGHQFLYMNGRYIVNYAIAKAIENCYKSMIPINRFPAFVLNIDIDPKEIDVNIHPTKQEIKFIDRNRVIGTISNIVGENLVSSLYVPKISLKKQEKEKKEEEIPKLFELGEPKSSEDIIIRDFTLDNRDVSHKSSSIESSPNMDVEDIYSNLSTSLNAPDLKDEGIFYIDNNIIHETDNKNSELKYREDVKEEVVEEQKIQDILLDIVPVGRVFNTYIIAESKEEEKIYFIDQHAAHERIMYEKYRREYSEEKISIQQLLIPEIIELNNIDMSRCLENIEIFKNLGFDLEEFGSNSIALRGVPLLFGTPQSKELFLDILDNIDSNIQSNYDTKVNKIMKIACTNAIKSGDNIDDIEIIALFKDLRKCENPFTCPHGRPTIVEMTKKDIEKNFLRIM
ncbi:DNA mismatch repair endonuclease MutL [Tissierellaceae bacterium HCP3S3_D8]